MKHSEGFLKLVNDAKSRIREVTVDETKQRMQSDKGVRLIDVREDNEWEAGHAAGSSHLGKGIIERDIEAEVPDKATERLRRADRRQVNPATVSILRKEMRTWPRSIRLVGIHGRLTKGSLGKPESVSSLVEPIVPLLSSSLSSK